MLARRPINLSVRENPIAQQSMSTKGDLQIIYWDTATFAQRNQAKAQKTQTPGVLGQRQLLLAQVNHTPPTDLCHKRFIYSTADTI